MNREQALERTLAMGVPFIEAGARATSLLKRVQEAGGEWKWLVEDRGLCAEIIDFLLTAEAQTLLSLAVSPTPTAKRRK